MNKISHSQFSILNSQFSIHLMYKYLLQSVEGIQWFGIGTLLLFFCTFCFAAIRAFISKKEDMQRMAELPLED